MSACGRIISEIKNEIRDVSNMTAGKSFTSIIANNVMISSLELQIHVQRLRNHDSKSDIGSVKPAV